MALNEFTLRVPGGAGLMIMKRVMRVAVQTDSNARENCCCSNNNFRNFINFRNQNDSKMNLLYKSENTGRIE